MPLFIIWDNREGGDRIAVDKLNMNTRGNEKHTVRIKRLILSRINYYRYGILYRKL